MTKDEINYEINNPDPSMMLFDDMDGVAMTNTEMGDLCKQTVISQTRTGRAEACEGFRYFVLENGETSIHVDLATVLKMVKTASDHSDMPPVPHDWWLEIASYFNTTNERNSLLNTKNVETEGGILDHFVTPCRLKHSRKISIHKFETAGCKRVPYRQLVQGKILLFALCPECHNPIQIFDLYETRHPYGQHTTSRIDGFEQFDVDKLQKCSLFQCPKL